ncbi:MAG: septal ring lytic transglycosylase RlpA family protein [Acidobacteriota bacterium]|nr:septal ring lytic transglycosylase RlpA family protein [Acidobacteriota bacterium]
MLRKGYLFLVIAGLFFLSYSCRTEKPVTAPPAGYVEVGEASWYGPGFHGRMTSSQEVFDMEDLTAAHQTLPFGTVVQVTNLENSRTVTVRINDRGPFIKGRIIDLSYAAARMLGLIGPGTARVRLEVVGFQNPDLQIEKGSFILQLGSFLNPDRARALCQNLKEKFQDVYISTYETTGGQVFYRVRLRAGSQEQAEQLARQLTASGYPVLCLKQ